MRKQFLSQEHALQVMLLALQYNALPAHHAVLIAPGVVIGTIRVQCSPAVFMNRHAAAKHLDHRCFKALLRSTCKHSCVRHTACESRRHEQTYQQGSDDCVNQGKAAPRSDL